MKDLTFEQLCELFNYHPRHRPLHTQEAATVLGMSIRTMDGWRQSGEGPRYFRPKGTRRVWYSEKDLMSWLASGAMQSTSELAVGRPTNVEYGGQPVESAIRATG